MWAVFEHEISRLEPKGDILIMEDLIARTGEGRDWVEMDSLSPSLPRRDIPYTNKKIPMQLKRFFPVLAILYHPNGGNEAH